MASSSASLQSHPSLPVWLSASSEKQGAYSRIRHSTGSSTCNSPTFASLQSSPDLSSRPPSPTHQHAHGSAYSDTSIGRIHAYVWRTPSSRTIIGLLASLVTILLLVNTVSHVSHPMSALSSAGSSNSPDNTAAYLSSILKKHFASSLTGSWPSWSFSASSANLYGIDQIDICPDCNDSSIRGAYSDSPFFSVPLPTREEVRLPSFTSSLGAKKRYLLHHVQRYLWLYPIHTSYEAVGRLSQTYLTRPDTLIALSFVGLELDKPTAYMYTRTGNGGRLTDDSKRLRYIQRHISTIKEHDETTRIEGHYDNFDAAERQLIWIVIEDDSKLNDQVAGLLNSSGLPYLYIAHGPTRHYGNAQWNIAERAVHILRDTFFGDGPVLNVDDDSRIESELLSRIWRLKKVVMWQVGNLRWEGPVFKNGKLVKWYTGTWPNRRFPIDMGGFAFNSSFIGDGRPIHPPKYVPSNGFGGETEFLQQFISNRSEVEPLCDNSAVERCHMSWHNWVERVKPAENLRTTTQAIVQTKTEVRKGISTVTP